MEAPCTTCHFVQTENAKTTFVLAIPKEQICFACHDKATILQQHTPEVRKNQTCVECHDSHSSGYPMLLLASADAEYRAKQPKKRPLRSGKLPANHASATLAKSPGKN
jgi:predicted CXXCH cytochrome family protein